MGSSHDGRGLAPIHRCAPGEGGTTSGFISDTPAVSNPPPICNASDREIPPYRYQDRCLLHNPMAPHSWEFPAKHRCYSRQKIWRNCRDDADSHGRGKWIANSLRSLTQIVGVGKNRARAFQKISSCVRQQHASAVSFEHSHGKCPLQLRKLCTQ